MSNKHNRSYANLNWVAELNINSSGRQVFESYAYPTRVVLCASLLKDLPDIFLHCCLNDLVLVFYRLYDDGHKEFAYHRSVVDFFAAPCRSCDIYHK